MITTYILRLLVMLPLVGGLAFGSLWLWRKVQPGLAPGQAERKLKLVETLGLGTTDRIAVVEFCGRELLLAISRGRIELLTEAAAATRPAPHRKAQS
jgi:flagellar protein FliO/FliZ